MRHLELVNAQENGQITEELFSYYWAFLEARFRVNHVEMVGEEYYFELLEEMTAGRFAQAALRAFRYNTFFPSPQELIDHAYGDLAGLAVAAWDEIIRRWANGADTFTDEGSLEREALGKLGGSRAVMECESHYARRLMGEEFRSRYIALARSRMNAETRELLGLPAASRPGQLGAGTPAASVPAQALQLAQGVTRASR